MSTADPHADDGGTVAAEPLSESSTGRGHVNQPEFDFDDLPPPAPVTTVTGEARST